MAFIRRIRPVNPLDDVGDVVHLIEEAFSRELNPSTQRALRDLSWLNRAAWLLGPLLWVTPFADLFSGLVWEEGKRVLGNVTLTRSRGGGPGCWMISNVVVAPIHRGRGIGRALMEEALAHIRSRGGRRIILQVRADNQAACHLYRDLGFAPVDTLLEMRLHCPWSMVGTPTRLPLRRRRNSDGPHEFRLAQEAIPAVAQEMRPQYPSTFRIGWNKQFFRCLLNLFGSAREFRLGIGGEGELMATLNVWAGRWRPYHRLQIMVHPQHRGQWEQGLVDHALALLQYYPYHPVYTEVHALHGSLVKALIERNFVIHRELAQMTLDLI